MRNYVPDMVLDELNSFSKRRTALMADISRAINGLSEDTLELQKQINSSYDDTERSHLQHEHDERYEAIEWLEDIYESLENVIC
ncbi:MAG: hypothetical protein IJS28_06925 [Synergistaceae bacterium]|nr:hypothetical protein [Synergistaceae bacterium]